VDRKGGYSKGRDMLTSAITKIPSGAVKAPRNAATQAENNTPRPRSHDRSSGVFIFSRSLTSVLVSVLILTLTGIAYLGSLFFTREHQLEHVRGLQKQMRTEMQELRTKNLELERRMVEIATTVENMQESND